MIVIMSSQTFNSENMIYENMIDENFVKIKRARKFVKSFCWRFNFSSSHKPRIFRARRFIPMTRFIAMRSIADKCL